MFYQNGKKISLFKHIEPNTPKAKEFFKEYGGLFMVSGQGNSPKGPLIRLKCCDEREITIVKQKDGIYVNGTKFCDDWKDGEEDGNVKSDS